MRLRMKVVRAKPARPSGAGFAIFVSVTGAILSEIEHDVVQICRWETPELAEVTSSQFSRDATNPALTLRRLKPGGSSSRKLLRPVSGHYSDRSEILDAIRLHLPISAVGRLGADV